MMNDAQRQHALDVAEAIEQHAGQYDQGRWAHNGVEKWDCGTPACIAGWSVAVQQVGVSAAARQDVYSQISLSSDPIPSQAARAFGLNPAEEELMFKCNVYGQIHYLQQPQPEATAAEAVAMLRHRAETGEVCWPEREE